LDSTGHFEIYIVKVILANIKANINKGNKQYVGHVKGYPTGRLTLQALVYVNS